MRKRLIRALVLVPVAFVLGIGVALAVELTAGMGITHEGATIGFNAKADLTGQITYVFHDGTGQMIQCDEITSYRTLKPTTQGFLRAKGRGRLHRQGRQPGVHGVLLRGPR